MTAIKEAFVCLVVVCGCTARASQKFPLRGATVVSPDAWVTKPMSGWGLRSAQDLTNALFRVTGKPSALVAESAATNLQGPVIWLGDQAETRAAGIDVGAIPKDQALIRVEPTRAFIAGRGEIGPSNGIVEFLQRHADWFFATMDGSDSAPFNPQASAPVGEYRFEPAFKFRYMLGCSAWPETGKRILHADFARRLRIPSVIGGNPDIPQAVMPGVGITGHSYYFYLWPRDYFKDHPDYYSLDRTGKRNAKRNRGGQLCLTNPALLDQITTNMLKKIAADRARFPGDDHPVIYDFSQNDSMDYLCACENCKRVVAKYNRVPGGNKEGGDAGLQLEFVNELARRVRAVYPDVIVRTFAYVSTEEPPEGIVPESNVMIWLCDLYGLSCHYLPLTHPFNADRLRIFRAWRKIARHMDVWDYWLYPGWVSGEFPEVHARAIAADLKLYAENGLDRAFCEAAFNRQCFFELNSFVMAQCLSHPESDPEPLVRIYCRVYGAAAEEMEGAIRFLENLQAEDAPPSKSAWHQRRLPYRTLENWTQFDAICKRAYAKADTPAAKCRIAAVLATTARERMRLTQGRAKPYSAAADDFRRYSDSALVDAPLAPTDIVRVRKETAEFLDRARSNFGDLPTELKSVSDDDFLLVDHHVAVVKPCWKETQDPGRGLVYRRGANPEQGAKPPYGCLLRDGDATSRYTLKPQADGKWHWYRLGTGRVGRESRFFIAPDNYLSFSLGSFYINCDGLADDPNFYEIWISAKFGGDPTEDPKTGLFVDRMVFRRLTGREVKK